MTDSKVENNFNLWHIIRPALAGVAVALAISCGCGILVTAVVGFVILLVGTFVGLAPIATNYKGWPSQAFSVLTASFAYGFGLAAFAVQVYAELF